MSGGPSQSELQLLGMQMTQVSQEIQEQTTQFAESQQVYNFLQPYLTSMVQNPTGFTAEELADLNATNVNVAGAQYQSAQQQLQLRQSQLNQAGLPSGVAQAELTGLQSAAAGQVAQGTLNIQLQNAQLAQQKQAMAQQQLQGMQSGQGVLANQIGQVENTAEAQAFSQANTINQQQQSSFGNMLLQGVLGGLTQTGLTAGQNALGMIPGLSAVIP